MNLATNHTATSRRAPTEPRVRRRTPIGPTDTAAPEPASRGLYSPEHAAAYLDISRAQLYRLISAGRLIGCRLGRLRRFTRAELDAFVCELEAEGRAS